MFSAPGGREWVDRVRSEVRPKVAALVEAAKEQGRLRDDLDVLDVPMIELMLASVIEFIGGASARTLAPDARDRDRGLRGGRTPRAR